jgi:hypothetical protein
MIYSSLAVLAMSASALINPFTNLVHLHPRPAQTDNRVNVTLINNGYTFQDVKIGDNVYTVMASHTLSIKAPAGTVVYAASATSGHHRGDPLLTVTPELKDHTVAIK